MRERRADKLDAVAMLETLWDEGYAIAAHQLGKCYRDGVGVQRDAEKAVEWFRRSAAHGNDCSEYALGKLLLEQGRAAEGIDWLASAAAQGNAYAQYFLDHRNDWQSASTGAAVLRMLHHMSRIFQDNAVADSTYRGMQIDRKRRREMQAKRIALGHKADDHEESLNNRYQQHSM